MASKKEHISRKAGSITAVWTSGIPGELSGLTFQLPSHHPSGKPDELGFPVKRSEVRKLAAALSDIADELEGQRPADPPTVSRLPASRKPPSRGK